MKKHKFNQTAKYQPPRLGSKRLKNHGLSKIVSSETTASLNLGLSSDFNEDSFRDYMNQTVNSGVDSFLGGTKRQHFGGPMTCREKKNIRMSEPENNFLSSRGTKKIPKSPTI